MTTRSNRTLGSVIKTKRHELGLTVRGLARAVELAPSSITRLEDDQFRPSDDILKRIGRVLHIQLDELRALAPGELPRFAPYLRAKYDLDDDAIAELEKHFEVVAKRRSRSSS
jgi:transcriptional regulator with XRE-family HTH domain